MGGKTKKGPRLLTSLSANPTLLDIRQYHENRGFATVRNLTNRARRKARDYYNHPYPGRNKALWPRRDRDYNPVSGMAS